MIRLIVSVGLVSFLLAFSVPSSADPDEPPGARLVRENNCAACHQIGMAPPRAPFRNGPSLGRAGSRIRPDWLGDYLSRPVKLRPSDAARMPDFRLSGWEVTALTAYFSTRRSGWPTPAAAEKAEGFVGFEAVFSKLPRGDAQRGRERFEQLECFKCHGDPDRGTSPVDAKLSEIGPDLRLMARKLTRRGMAAILFNPAQVFPGTKMPSYFFDSGEAMDEDSPQQMADLIAYLKRLGGEGERPGDVRFLSARRRFPDATAEWGRRIAGQLNCAGCHEGTGIAPRHQSEVAVPLGYRNLPRFWSLERLAAWIWRPSNVPMHERMMRMGRMPTFGFTSDEARQIASWLLSIDGERRRRMGGMGMMGRGMMR